jgi:peptide/nickel transport system substrate-binding protein
MFHRLMGCNLLLTLAVAAMLGCQAAPKPGESTGAATGEPKQGGVAVFANREDPSTWDPQFSAGITLSHVAAGVFGSGNLVKQCRTDVYKTCPYLAESWEASPDLTQWTFKIRDNVYWHDGTRMTPEDLEFWLRVQYNGLKVGDKTRPASSTKTAWGDLKQIEVLDGNRLRLTLGAPQPVYLSQISDPMIMVGLSRHLMKARMEAGEVMLSPQDVGNIGLGPFKFVKHDKGSMIQVRRWEKHWEKDEQGRPMPYLDGIDFPIMGDLNTIIAAFRTGRLDGGARGTGFSLLPQQITALERDMGDKVNFVKIAGQRWFLMFNTVRPGPAQDVRVRKAIALWIDKRAGNQAVMGGQGFLHTLMDPRSPWPNPDWEKWPGFNEATRAADRQEAKRLMTEAGVSGGVKLQNLCRKSWVTFCEWLNADLAGLGVDMPLDLKDDATWVQQSRTTTDWDSQILRFDRLFPEALEVQMTRASLNSGARIKHEDPKILEFFRRFEGARSLEQRQQIYRELERYTLLDQVYAVPLFDEVFAFPYRSYVKGLNNPPEDVNHNLDFASVWLDK